MTPDLVAEYAVPPVSDVGRTHEAVLQLFLCIQGRLRGSGNSPIHVTFPLDVFRSLFGGKGSHAAVRGYCNYHAVDFSSIPGLPPTWNYLVDKTGVGRQVVFPVLMKPMLHWSKENFQKDKAGNIVKVDNRMPLERVILRVCTDAYKL